MTYTFAAVFLLLAPVLLGLRFARGRPTWWVIAATIVVVGWVAYLGATLSYFEYLWQLVDMQDPPDEDLLERAASDGGPMMGAVIGGGLFSILYALPWLAAYLIAVAARASLRRRSARRQTRN